jgi:hypothetical protein
LFFHRILEIQLTCKFIILYPWANQNIKLFFILCNFIIKKTFIKTYKPYIHFDYIFFFLFFSFSFFLFFLHTQYTIQNTNSKQINKNYMKITIKAPKQSGIYRDSLLHQQNSVRQTSGTVWTVVARLLHAPPWLAAREPAPLLTMPENGRICQEFLVSPYAPDTHMSEGGRSPRRRTRATTTIIIASPTQKRTFLQSMPIMSTNVASP